MCLLNIRRVNAVSESSGSRDECEYLVLSGCFECFLLMERGRAENGKEKRKDRDRERERKRYKEKGGERETIR